MATYDGVVGIDEPALNQFVKSVYQAVHDEVLKGNVPVRISNVTVTSIDYDIASVPQISLTPSALVRAMRRETFADLGLQDAALDEAADAHSKASLGLTIQTLAVGLHYADGAVTQLQASVRAGLEVVVETDGDMTPSLVTLVIDVPGNPALFEIINHGLVPELMNLIEQTFLEPIRIPPLGLGSVQVAPPVIATGQGRLLATTALVPTVPDPAPLAGAWPQQTVFAAFDAAILNALINSQLAGQTFAGHWEKTFKILLVSVTIKADYQVKVSNVALEVVPEQDGQLRGTADLDIFVNLKASNFASFTADATATPTARVTVSITSDNQVVAKLNGFDRVKLHFDFHNVPPVIDGILDLIVKALGPQIVGVLNSALSTLPAQPITKIPSIPIVVEGKTVVITLKDLAVTTLQTPDNKTLLAVTGGADVVLTPLIADHTVRNAMPELAAAPAKS